MHRLLRIVLTWLLALALPAQGYAAQAMLFCGPVHDQVAASSAAGHDHAAHGHGGWQAVLAGETRDHAAHEHNAHNDHVSAGPHEPPSAGVQDDGNAQPPDGESADKAAQAKCSVCASCCSMAAIASAYALPDTGRLAFEYAVAPFEPHDGRTAGGLERPPKARLA